MAGTAVVWWAVHACGDRRRAEVPGDTALAFPAAESAPSSPPDTASDTALAPLTRTDSAADAELGLAGGVLAADSAAGDAVFHGAGRCFTCHGVRGTGLTNLGPKLTDDNWLHGDGSLLSIRRIVVNGVAVPKLVPIAMPAAGGQLTPAQIRQVAAYVYALSHPGSTVAAMDTAKPPGGVTGTRPAPDGDTNIAPR